jgi:hypothetical protein
MGRPRRRAVYSDRLIVLMFFWAVWHDRPMCWACQPEAYGGLFRPGKLPSVSRFSRRLRTERCRELLSRVHELLARGKSPAPLIFIDGKAMPVSESSKDRDARTGRGGGRFSRGYRLHAVVTPDARLIRWAVTPMNTHEISAARVLTAGRTLRGLVLADGNYDSGPLYQHIHQAGGSLLTPLRMHTRGAKTLEKTCSARLEAIQAWRDQPERIGAVYRLREGVERLFANLVSFPGGLAPLPAWVRTLPRVTRWVGAKISIYHARRLVRLGLANL